MSLRSAVKKLCAEFEEKIDRRRTPGSDQDELLQLMRLVERIADRLDDQKPMYLEAGKLPKDLNPLPTFDEWYAGFEPLLDNYREQGKWWSINQPGESSDGEMEEAARQAILDHARQGFRR